VWLPCLRSRDFRSQGDCQRESTVDRPPTKRSSIAAVIALPVIELLASLAIFAFFLRNRHGLSPWKVWVCPALAALALALVTWLIIDQLDLFTARTGIINATLPLVVLTALLLGCGRAL
jgi:hypothetical protein